MDFSCTWKNPFYLRSYSQLVAKNCVTSTTTKENLRDKFDISKQPLCVTYI